MDLREEMEEMKDMTVFDFDIGTTKEWLPQLFSEVREIC